MLDLREGMKGDSPYSAIKDLSATERELMGISKPADAAHDPDPVLDSDPEAPPAGKAKPLPAPAPKPPLPAGDSDEDSDALPQQKPAAPVKKPTPPPDSDDESQPQTKPGETKKVSTALRQDDMILCNSMLTWRGPGTR